MESIIIGGVTHVMANRTYVYVAGPYMGQKRLHDFRDYEEIDRNISRAREAAAFLANSNVPYFCPHLNSAHFEVITPNVKPEYWYQMDIELLKPASAILLLGGWEDSKGTLKEIEVARELHIPVFYPEERDELVEWWKEGFF